MYDIGVGGTNGIDAEAEILPFFSMASLLIHDKRIISSPLPNQMEPLLSIDIWTKLNLPSFNQISICNLYQSFNQRSTPMVKGLFHFNDCVKRICNEVLSQHLENFPVSKEI